MARGPGKVVATDKVPGKVVATDKGDNWRVGLVIRVTQTSACLRSLIENFRRRDNSLNLIISKIFLNYEKQKNPQSFKNFIKSIVYVYA